MIRTVQKIEFKGDVMDIIYIFDEEKAKMLLAKGFKYIEKNIDNKKAFQFYGTDELMKELHSKFDASSFFVSKRLLF